ncbi:amino acid aminotransferase [Luteimonas sp. MJ293]|uniref:amino acid aminotransferase n=1 Tax=Luteimonas sp. MJ146 TaxID=3129240 RepID=UPI0031B9E200
MSIFSNLELVPGDPILGLTDAFRADPRPTKVNLGVGIYYDEEGRIPVMGAVQQVERTLAEQSPPRGYLPIDGMPDYRSATRELLFGAESALIRENRASTTQTIGGSGALRVGADLLKHALPFARVAISTPSWENHRALFPAAGFEVVDYTYFDDASHGLDFDGMLADLGKLEAGTVVLLHACCHNPTGADLTRAQWAQVIDLLHERGLVPFLDMAYQGFDQGIAEDAHAIRLLAESPIRSFLVASSFSKSFSLYGERIGALTVVSDNAEENERVQSQVKRLVRTNYSSPSNHGAALVAGVLNDPALRTQWEAELGQMRTRIHALRDGLVERLAANGAADFEFIRHQAGMFSYSGLSRAQVDRLREEFGIYAVGTGRICVAGLNMDNIDYVAEAVSTVSRG